jgi:bcr-type benzoyl-CoA reductase subunit C
MEEIQLFHKVINDIEYPPAFDASRKIIGYLCSYAPEELIHAAGFHPMRLFPSQSEIILGENHIQSYCCHPVRGILEDSLAGKLDFLYGTVFVHTCDSMQRLSDIWRMQGKYNFFSDLALPVKLGTKSAQRYLNLVLADFRKQLEKLCGHGITDTDIKNSITLFNSIRDLLSDIYRIRCANPESINAADIYALVKGTMIMDRQKAETLLRRIARNLGQNQTCSGEYRRIIISGSICDSNDFYSIVEKAGAAVVGDDLCTGQRWFDTKILQNQDKDPVAAIAARLTGRVPCPAKHMSLSARKEHISALAEKTKADGVIFLVQKFCDPHAFDYPHIKEHLDLMKIKSICIETDGINLNPGQLTTRIETFIHMI